MGPQGAAAGIFLVLNDYCKAVPAAAPCKAVPGLRPGMPRGPAGAAGLQTLHTKLPYITPSMPISSNK